MKITRHITFGILLTTIVVWMSACSRETEQFVRFEVVPFIGEITDIQKETKTTTAPSGYSVFAPTTSAADNQIGVFMTTAGQSEALSATTGTLNYSGDGKWQTFFPSTFTTGDYYVYGYMPSGAGTPKLSATDNDYSKGATLELTDVNPVSVADLCLLTGVGDKDEALTRGSYFYNVANSGDNTNYLSLLLDHLFTRINIKMAIGTSYSALRCIKVTEMTVSTETNKGTLSITMPTSSVAMAVTFTPSTTESTEETLPLSITDGLPTVMTLMTQFHCPTNVKTFTLKTTYDVLDSSGKKTIRSGCYSENTFTMTQAFDRGISYDLNMTVEPTYIYKITGDDLNSPTFTVHTN